MLALCALALWVVLMASAAGTVSGQMFVATGVADQKS